MIMAAVAPVAFVLGALFGMNFQMSFYGLETYEPISVAGIILFAVIMLKGFAAYLLWTEKDNAIMVAQIDAIVGIAICIFMMTGYRFVFGESSTQLRLELLLLIPYLVKLNKIKQDWNSK